MTALARAMVEAIEQQCRDGQVRQGAVESGAFHLVWHLHPERRLGDKVYAQVFTIKAVEIAEEYRGRGVLTEFIRLLLRGDPAPQIPMRFLHFQECGPGLSRLLQRLHFHRYLIGQSVDWWHIVDGQGELL